MAQGRHGIQVHQVRSREREKIIGGLGGEDLWREKWILRIWTLSVARPFSYMSQDTPFRIESCISVTGHPKVLTDTKE